MSRCGWSAWTYGHGTASSRCPTCPAGTSRRWCWPAGCEWAPRCSSSTSPPRASTSAPSPTSTSSSTRRPPTAPPCSSSPPTTRNSSGCAIGCWSCGAGRSPTRSPVAGWTTISSPRPRSAAIGPTQRERAVREPDPPADELPGRDRQLRCTEKGTGMTVNSQTPLEPDVAPKAGSHAAPTRRSLTATLGLERFSGLYVWAALILLFALWVPNLFLTATNFRIIAGSQAITAMVALGLIVPVACGAFDLSIGGTLGMGVCIVVWFQANHHGFILGIFAAVAFGLLVGLVNAFVVVMLHVDSFIATLGMGSILSAGTTW